MNSVRGDDWTAESALIASNAVRTETEVVRLLNLDLDLFCRGEKIFSKILRFCFTIKNNFTH